MDGSRDSTEGRSGMKGWRSARPSRRRRVDTGGSISQPLNLSKIKPVMTLTRGAPVERQLASRPGRQREV